MTSPPNINILNDTRVLVTGATGLTGSAVVRALLDANDNVTIVAGHRSDAGLFVDDPRVTYVKADLCKREECDALARGCDMAVMTAAVTGGAGKARNEPWKQVTNNVILDTQTFDSLHSAGISRVVYISTATVYQEIDGYISEQELDLNIDPPLPYLGVGWAKRYIEKLAEFWHRKAGMEIILLRASNIYGPGARFNPAASNFIPALIRKAVDNADPFEVWGSLDVSRDVIFTDDMGAACVAALVQKDVVFDAFNIGSGKPVTVGDVVDLALKFADHSPNEISLLGDKPKTIPVRALNCDKSLQILEWSPLVDIEDGIRLTVEWWSQNKDTWKR